MPLEALYSEDLSDVMFWLEGAIDGERGYFEYMNYSLFSSIRQALGNKKNFENPFEKKEIKSESQKLTEDEYESEVEAVKKLFNL